MKLNYQHPLTIKKYVVTYPAKILLILEKEAVSNSGWSTQAQSKSLGQSHSFSIDYLCYKVFITWVWLNINTPLFGIQIESF